MRATANASLRPLAFVLALALAPVLALGAAAPARATPEVVVSLKPLHGLIASVMRGIGEPLLLLDGGASPHDHALRPSESRALRRADLVFWVGPSLERFLERPLASLSAPDRLVTLSEAPGVIRLPRAAPGEHDDEDRARDRDEHGHGGFDPHIWLSPDNARAILRLAAARLAAVDPANAARYGANAALAEREIADLEAKLAALLAPLRGRPYLVFHDAYRYFEAHFGIRNAGAVALDPERAPGARHVADLRRRIAERGVSCIFREPQFEPALIEALVSGSAVRIGVLDPLGTDLAAGPKAYGALLTGLATALRDCLAP